ncbi:MAG: hypothetical protein HZA54_10860, partial [Planctomycetes bacterium]|nr:hypothetical protein [Planctomycetota bacterium]
AAAPSPAGAVHGSRRPVVEDYNHCLAALALVEAWGMSGDETWKAPAQRALDAIVRAPRPAGLQWTPFFSAADLGFSVFAIAALAEGAALGLVVPPATLADARAYLEALTDADTGQVHYRIGHPRCLAGLDGTATLLAARRLAGFPAEHPAHARAAAFLAAAPAVWEAWFPLPPADPAGSHAAHLPTNHLANFFFWRFGALAAAGLRAPAGTPAAGAADGGPLAAWNADLGALLIDHQRVGGIEDGSWDPVGVWARVGGRVYTTAMGVLALTSDTALDFAALPPAGAK